MPVDSEKISTFDQSKEKIVTRLEKCLNDPAWLKQMLDWYRHAESDKKSVSPQKQSRLDFTLSHRGRFLLDVPRRIQDIEDLYSVRFAEDPSILQQLSFPSEQSDNHQEDNSSFRAASLPEWSRPDYTLSSEDQQKKEIINRILDVDQFPELQTKDSVYGRLLDKLELDSELFDELAYHYFVFQDVVTAIKSYLPGLSDVIDEINDHSAIIESTAQNDLLPFGYSQVEHIHLFIVRTYSNRKEIGKFHALYMVVMIHEFLHALTYKLLDLKSLPNPKDEQKTSLRLTILEGIALAFEYEMTKKVLRNSGQDETTEVLRAFRTSRQKNEQLNPDNDPYHEGGKISQALVKRGWSIFQLPILLAEIKEIVQVEKLEDIEISNDPNSKFQQLVEKISQLDPPTQSDAKRNTFISKVRQKFGVS